MLYVGKNTVAPNNVINTGIEQVQSDYAQVDTTAVDYIKNKPTLASVATSGDYSDLSNTPTIPTVNDATLTITQNGTSVGTFTANASSDVTVNLTDTTYTSFVGADGSTAGSSGLVPAPGATDNIKYLKGDGNFSQVAYSEISGTPTIPTVNDATLTISQNGVLKGVFTANSSTNVDVLLENLPADFITNQNSAQTATTPLKVWEGTSSDYADQTSSTGTFYAWDMSSGGWTGYTMEYPITNSSVIYWYSAGEYGPTSNTIIYTDGTAMFVRDDYEEFHYAPEKNIVGSNIGPDTVCLIEGVGIKRNGVDIANLSSGSTTAEEIVNANEATGATSPLKVWQGTEQEWINGVGTDWYNWRTDITYTPDFTRINNNGTITDGVFTGTFSITSANEGGIYKTLGDSFTYNNSVDVIIKFKMTNLTQSSQWRAICTIGTTREDFYNVPNNAINLTTTGGKNDRFYWFYGGNTTDYILPASALFADMVDNTWYWLKLTYDKSNSMCSTYQSEDGINYTSISSVVYSLDSINFNLNTVIGLSEFNATTGYTGSIDLYESCIKADGSVFWSPYIAGTYSECFTLSTTPEITDTVYSEPNTTSALTITSIGTGTITLSDNNTYTYTSSGDVTTYQTIGNAYPNWLCNINGVGVKVGNTLVANATDTSGLQSLLTAGTGIDITNNTISVTSPTLTNTATGSNSLTILGDANSADSSVNIGVGSKAYSSSVAVGSYAKATGIDSVAIGANVYTHEKMGSVAIGELIHTWGDYNISIGYGSTTFGNHTIQIGAGRNDDANTVKFGNGTNNWTLLDLTTGLIPDARLSSNVQTTSNLVTSVSSSSTDTQYPSAKLFYDTVGNIEATLDAIISQGSNS